jgi:hypothetical protein
MVGQPAVLPTRSSRSRSSLINEHATSSDGCRRRTSRNDQYRTAHTGVRNRFNWANPTWGGVDVYVSYLERCLSCPAAGSGPERHDYEPRRRRPGARRRPDGACGFCARRCRRGGRIPQPLAWPPCCSWSRSGAGGCSRGARVLGGAGVSTAVCSRRWWPVSRQPRHATAAP